MNTGRLEAFSDGVIAIIITIMVLNLKVPSTAEFSDMIATTGPGILTYLLSFIYVGIYWNNHHHTLQITERIDGTVLWANLALLFVLSFLPFSTEWMAEQAFARSPVILYGVNLFAAGVAYVLLQLAIERAEGKGSGLRRAVGRDWKGPSSIALYAAGVIAALVDVSGNIGTKIALAIFVVVALLWFIPDQRIDRQLNSN